MKLQARNFVVRNPETIDITMFFKKFCIATRTNKKAPNLGSGLSCWLCGEEDLNSTAVRRRQTKPQWGFA